MNKLEQSNLQSDNKICSEIIGDVQNVGGVDYKNEHKIVDTILEDNHRDNDRLLQNEIHESQKIKKSIAELDSKIDIGQFKDVDSLYSAYKSLQAEFTRKCQSLQKLTLAQSDFQNAEVTDNKMKLENFLKENGYFATDDIKQKLLQKIDANNNIDLSKEYIFALQDNQLNIDSLLNDDSFFEKHISSNSDIKKKVLLSYLSKMEKAVVPPLNKGKGAFSAMKKKTPATIKEAGEFAKNIINQK